MNQTDQTGFQEYYFTVSSLQRQYSLTGDFLGWDTNTHKERGKKGKYTSVFTTFSVQVWSLQ